MLVERIRGLLLAVLVIGMVATLADLLLLSHYEDIAQLVPLAIIALSLLAVVWHVLRPSAAAVRALQGAMIVLMATAAAGIGLHFNGAARVSTGNRPFLELGPAGRQRSYARTRRPCSPRAPW